MGEEDIVVTVKVAENGSSVPVVETSDDFVSKKEGGKGKVEVTGEDNKCDGICKTETVAEEPTATGEKKFIAEIVDEKKLSEEVICKTETVAEEVTATGEKESLVKVVDEKKLSEEETKDVNESKDLKEEEKQEPIAVVTEVESESKENNEAAEKEESVTEFVGDELDTVEAVPMEETVTETTVVECVTTETVEIITQAMELESEIKEVEKEDVIMEMVEEDSKPREMEEVAERVEPEKELALKDGELEVTDEVKEKAEGKEEVKEEDESKPESEAKEKEENKNEVDAEVKVDCKEEGAEEQESKEDMEAQEKEDSLEKLEANEEESKEVEAESEDRNKDMEVEEEEETKDDMETQEKEESEDKVHDEVEGKVANSKRKKSRGKKRSRSRSAGKSNVRVSNDKTEDVKLKKELEPKTPVAYVNDRPVRERKSVERLVAVVDNDSSRELHIRKGRGTALKDIPNVSYKISRAKTDENFKLLHMVLYGRRGKEEALLPGDSPVPTEVLLFKRETVQFVDNVAIEVKHNVSQFSGFVWHGDEEKQRLKIKEKLDRFSKDKMLEFCDLFDIPIPKPSSIRKEDVLLKLIDFLEVPNAMTDVLLGEKEQGSKGSKRKRPVKQNSSSGATPSKGSAKRQRKAVEDSKEEAKSPVGTDDESDKDDEMEEEENEKDAEDQTEDEKHSGGEEKENESDGGSAEKSNKRKGNSSSAKKQSLGKKKTQEVPITRKRSTPQAKVTQKKLHPNSSKVDEDESPKMLSSRSKDVKIAKESPSTPKGKSGKTSSKGKKTLSDSELRDTICEILKEVDFNTATFTDILQRLGKKYKKDLTSRKASIKQMIQEELTKLADEADEEEEDSDGSSDSEKNDVKAAERKVKA